MFATRLASFCTIASVVLLSGIFAPCLSSPILARTRQLLDLSNPGILKQQAEKAKAAVQRGTQKVTAALQQGTEKVQATLQQGAQKAQASLQEQTQKAQAALSHAATTAQKAVDTAQQRHEANRAHVVEVAKEQVHSSVAHASGMFDSILPMGGRRNFRRSLSTLSDLTSYFADMFSGGGHGQAPVGAHAPAASMQSDDSDPPAPAQAPGTVPEDKVGLAAAGDDGDGSNDGGIQVVTSNPISLSNPIDLGGGNYNGQLDTAFGK